MDNIDRTNHYNRICYISIKCPIMKYPVYETFLYIVVSIEHELKTFEFTEQTRTDLILWALIGQDSYKNIEGGGGAKPLDGRNVALTPPRLNCDAPDSDRFDQG